MKGPEGYPEEDWLGPFGHPAFLILQTTVGSYPYRTAVVRELFDHSWASGT